MRNKGFEGWYFKHQKGDDMLAFIPGRAESGAFIQMIDAGGSRQFDVPELTVKNGIIRAGSCLFSRRDVIINLPGVSGNFTYGRLTPLRSDIMGPFRFLPMECRHSVISLGHTLMGSMTVNGVRRCFDGGLGYIEKDSGTSFPRSYLWLQCNGFLTPCSIMMSIAHIPVAGFCFTGCICAIIYRGQEYRFATYNGVRIHSAGPEHICLSKGSLLLEIDIVPFNSGHMLRSPVCGQMSGSVRESCNAFIHVRLWNKGKAVFDLSSPHAVYEAVL